MQLDRRPRRTRRVHWVVYVCRLALSLNLLCASMALSSACSPTETPEPLPTHTPDSNALPRPGASPAPTDTPTPSGDVKTLTVWVTEQIVPLDEGDQARIFQQQIAAFEATHPGVNVRIVHKKPEGKGGIEDFLTTASAVAPATVPDLIALDTNLLPSIARKDLIVPLDGLFSPAIQEDLYPFAIDAGVIDEQLMGAQFEVERVEHAIYNPNKIAIAPLTWTEVFSSGATYIFPAAGRDGQVNDAFLIQYLSTGAELLDANGDPALDQDALKDVLEFYQQGIERGAILTDVLEYSTVEQCWPKYLQAEVVMCNISSDLYLAVKPSQATAIPTRDGKAVTLSRGHAWVLATRDPALQPLAIKLLEWLMNPANMAAWSQSAGYLPTRRAAFEQMGRDEYVKFIRAQLEQAIPHASSEAHLRIYRAMQQAIDAVLEQGVLPATAAQDVLKAVDQEVSR